MPRRNFSTAAPWEPIVGYSRAVRVDNLIFVTGTTALDGAGNVVARGDAAGQTRRILEIIDGVLRRAGATMRDVVRTRIFVTDIARWEEVGRVHGEVFRDIRPATTMVEVSRLIVPEMRVEIEADAIVQE